MSSLHTHTGPAANLLMGVVPTAYMRGSRETFFPGEMNFPRFTATLGERVWASNPITCILQLKAMYCMVVFESH